MLDGTYQHILKNTSKS